jgi:hypothetical protein
MLLRATSMNNVYSCTGCAPQKGAWPTKALNRLMGALAIVEMWVAEEEGWLWGSGTEVPLLKKKSAIWKEREAKARRPWV